MKKLMTFVTVVALASVVASQAMAYRSAGGWHDRGPGGYGMMDVTRGVDLTAEQEKKISDLREAYFKEVKPIQDQLYAKSGELRNLWLARTPDQEKIMALQKEARILRDQLTDKITAFRQAVRKVLTPEQRLKVRPYGLKKGMDRDGAGMPRPGSGAGMQDGHAPGRGMR